MRTVQIEKYLKVRPSYEAPTTIYVVNNLQSASAAAGGSGSKTGHNFLNLPYSLQVRFSFVKLYSNYISYY